MFNFGESMKQSMYFGRKFEYQSVEYTIVYVTDLKKPLQEGEEKELTWVFACKASDGVPAPILIVPCSLEALHAEWKKEIETRKQENSNDRNTKSNY